MRTFSVFGGEFFSVYLNRRVFVMSDDILFQHFLSEDNLATLKLQQVQLPTN